MKIRLAAESVFVLPDFQMVLGSNSQLVEIGPMPADADEASHGTCIAGDCFTVCHFMALGIMFRVLDI